MRKSVQLRIFAMVLFALLAGAASAHAQATRTWVSGVGDDANPCSRTAPCKTFAGAISKTAPCGEIDVLDPGGFGALTITKCISIETDDVSVAGVLVSGTNGFVISAGATDVVMIRGITFDGLGTGLAGIKVLSAGALFVEECWINHFNGNGAGTGSAIDISPGSPTTNLVVSLKEVKIRDCGAAGTFGILIAPAAGITVNASLDRVSIENSSAGLRVQDRSKVTVRDSNFANNTGNGVTSASGGAAVELNLETVAISGNSNGIVSSGGASTVRISNVSVFSNGAIGLDSISSGAIISFKNNSVQGNVGGDGAPTSSPGQI